MFKMINNFPTIFEIIFFSFSNLIIFTKTLSSQPFLLKTFTSEKSLKINLQPFSVNLKNRLVHREYEN